MTTRHIEGGDGVGKYLNDKDAAKSGLAKTLATAAKAWRDAYGEIPFPSVATPVEQSALVKTPEAQAEIKTFSKDQLILPKEPSKEALALLKKAEQVGLGGIFAIHRFSDVRLTQDTQVPGWNKKPEQWYWDQIAKGTIGLDSARLPGEEVLIDKIRRPNYNNGRQLHENDPLAHFLRTLRKEKKLPTIKGIPNTSRFGIPPDELYPIVFAEMANRLESEVRLPTEIEFNVLGNFVYHHFGEANTYEWLHDKFEDVSRLIGGNSDLGGLAFVSRSWSVHHSDIITFRPLVAVSSKA